MGAAATVAGIFFPGAESLAATRAIDLPISETEQTLLDFISQFGGRVRFAGAGVLEKLRSGGSKRLHALVELDDLATFESALAQIPFSGAYASGSELAFSAGGTEFTLESLPKNAFDERRMRLTRSRYIAFAHDALSYDPADKRLYDPFGATRAKTVRTVNRAFGSIEGIKVVLRGLIEAQQLDLPPGADFHRWKARLLRLMAREKDAAAIASALLNQLASAAEILPAATIQELLRTRSVKSAFAQALGVDTEAAITAYEARRAGEPGSVSNAAIWLSILLAAQLQGETETGVLTNALQNGSRFQVLRSRGALAQARDLLTA